MSWCLAGLGDALNRVKREGTKSHADLVDAMRYAMRYAMGTSALDREPDGDTGSDADE